MLVSIMWKHTLVLVCLSSCCLAGPLHGIKRNVPIVMRDQETAAEAEHPAPEPIAPEFPDIPSTLTLPSNATSIRTDITDNFSCDDKVYGYYADVENECQIFHVCLPVTYADGKENTFRWSFICPEETIFSQDSFTCMRREDMSIECADSVRYYELNSNFGMTEEQTMNSNSAQSIAEPAEEQSAPEESMQTEVQQPAMSEPKPEMAAAPMPALAQAKPMKEKPVKLPKPNRRKPQPKPQIKLQQDQIMSSANKQPSIKPLRKMPAIGTKLTVNKPVEAEPKPVVEPEPKPAPPRYKKRPAVIKISEKENAELPVPPFKVDMFYKASNPESYKRKRPTFAHKTSEVDNKLDEKVTVVETVPEPVAVDPVDSAIKFETNLNSAPVPSKEEAAKISDPVAQTVEETPMESVQVTEDAEAQPSETGEVFVAPENVLKTALESAATQVKDTESVAIEDEKDEEKLAEEESVKNDELLTQEATIAEEIAPVEVTQTTDEVIAPIEANEETPAVLSETVDNVPDAQPIEEASYLQDIKALPEAQALPEQPSEIEDQLFGASEPAALGIVPEAIAPVEHAEEALPALPSLEELEEEKPANAVESMPATAEMEQQDPIVQQAFAETDSHMQSVGGFKPVDPKLAAEAETLLSHFVSALKSDNPNLKPIKEEVSAASVEKEDAKVELEATQASEDKKLEEEVKKDDAMIKADADPLKPALEEQPALSTLNEDMVAPVKDTPVEEETKVEDSPMLKFPISNSFPTNMYQIPVTVIQTPYEEESVMQEAQKSVEEQGKVEETLLEAEPEKEKQEEPEEPTLNQEVLSEKEKIEDAPAVEALPEDVVESQPDAAQPDALVAQPDTVDAAETQSAAVEQPAPAVAYRPISIDDIVELVKERLDQTPADEKGTPMELVMEPSNADKPLELKLSTQQKGTAAQEESAEQTPAEDIIFPIYHRLSAPETIAVEEPSPLVTEIEKLPAEATAVKSIAAPIVQSADQAVQTDAEVVELNVDKAATTANTKTEAMAMPVQETESVAPVDLATPDALKQKDKTELAAIAKASRAFRARSLAKAKLDPRKRRFLFKADAS